MLEIEYQHLRPLILPTNITERQADVMQQELHTITNMYC